MLLLNSEEAVTGATDRSRQKCCFMMIETRQERPGSFLPALRMFTGQGVSESSHKTFSSSQAPHRHSANSPAELLADDQPQLPTMRVSPRGHSALTSSHGLNCDPRKDTFKS